MKLRNRLTLTFTVVTAVALLASFVVTYFLVERDELREIDRALLVQAEHAAAIVSLGDVDDASRLEGPAEAVEPPSLIVRYAAVYDRSGALRATTRSFTRAPRSLSEVGLSAESRAATPFDFAGRDLRAVMLPVGNRRLLLYAISRAGVDADLRYLVRVFSGLLVLGTFMTWLVARWLGRELSRDVDAIGQVTEDVAGGNLSARVRDRASTTVETRSLSRRLDEMISRLSELVAAQRVFVSSAAHELRSPLTSLRGELELALRRERTAPEYRETIERALADAVALVVLADDLLALARIDDKRGPDVGLPKRDAALVKDVLDDARRMARGNAEARNVRVLVEARCEGDLVGVPRQDGARALRNLLDNAIAHSPDGGEVALVAEKTDGSVRIAVEDHGPGVGGEDEPLIFSPFYRGPTERAAEGAGAGLGLSLAREIARTYGGDVALDKAYTQGARFVLSLPLSSTVPAEL
jgi:two-component system heavy metal sensor histidine kinase CusS